MRMVLPHLSPGAGRAASGLMPLVQGVGGGLPQAEPGCRIVELWVTLVQAQVFGPELEPE